MKTETHEPAKALNFSLAFERMVNFVAIARTQEPFETLKQLTLQCFVILPDDRFRTPHDVASAIETLFGLRVGDSEIAAALRSLVSIGSLKLAGDGTYELKPVARANVDRMIDEARQLEADVKSEWLADVHAAFPTLNSAAAWTCLRSYLGSAFRRHGMQTVALLDPAADVDAEHAESLSQLLHEAVRSHFDKREHDHAIQAISQFCATASAHVRRAQYVAQLADGAFNYFALTISPDIAKDLRGQLQPLVLLLDTNFQFGILGLHVNPQVGVSLELLQAIREHKLPFRLRYHEATAREMDATLAYYGRRLLERKWTQSISRAASQAQSLSGIEIKYHSVNGTTPTDADDFLEPYRHWDELLKGQGIEIYRVHETNELLQMRADLESEYRAFLKKRQREKPDEAIQHDMAVLASARSMRTAAKTTLGAGAIIVTCDYTLYRFDWEWSRSRGVPTCTVLPNLFWQIMRPFMPSDTDFDRAFVDTFALPEFSTLGSGAARAASRMLSILASYKDIPEETATRILSNELLIEQLRIERSEARFAELVESAVATENATLMEEKAALARQLEAERSAREAREREVEAGRAAAEKTAAELAQAKEQIDQANREAKDREREAALENARRRDQEDQLRAAEAKAAADARAAQLQAARLRAALGIVLGVVAAGVFELLVHLVGWQWLLDHPQGYGIRLCAAGILIFGIIGLLVPSWRKFCLGTVVLGAVLVLFQIIGGRTTAPSDPAQRDLSNTAHSSSNRPN